MQPDLNLRRRRLAARLSQMVTAKPLGQLKKTGVVASFVTLAWHDSAVAPGSIPGWGVLAFFNPAELHLLRSFFLIYVYAYIYIHIYIYIYI